MSVVRNDFLIAIGALVGTAGALRFEHQIRAMGRALDSRKWTLKFDDELDSLIRQGMLSREHPLNISESDLWALAILTDPSGDEWRTEDGKNWTQGERKMIL